MIEDSVETDFINEKFEHLKFLFECPRLFLSNFFNDLKAEIDSSFALKEQSINDKEILTENWTNIIKRVEEFELECFRAKKKNEFQKEFQQEMSELISLIASDLIRKKADNVLDDLISQNILKIEKELFLNKTIVYLDESKTERNIFDEIDLETTAGKLLIINDQYLSSNELQLLKENTCVAQSFTNGILKAKELTKFLESNTNDSQIICEIELDVKNSTHIYFNYSEINRIDSNVFDGFDSLFFVNFNSNQIKSIESKPFSKCLNFTFIDLSGNLITVIDKNAFNGLSKLKKLYLGANKLKTIHPKTFSSLLSLNLIDLSENLLEDIDSSLFSGLTNLESIWLDENNLRTLKSFQFSGLVNLKIIDLSANQLFEINEETFHNLVNLSNINLSKNKLCRIHSNTFKGLENLTHIDLSSNQIVLIERETFSGLTKLNRIYLNNNQLESTINKRSFHKLPIKW